MLRFFKWVSTVHFNNSLFSREHLKRVVEFGWDDFAEKLLCDKLMLFV
jgi:hypothetical protein